MPTAHDQMTNSFFFLKKKKQGSYPWGQVTSSAIGPSYMSAACLSVHWLRKAAAHECLQLGQTLDAMYNVDWQVSRELRL